MRLSALRPTSLGIPRIWLGNVIKGGDNLGRQVEFFTAEGRDQLLRRASADDRGDNAGAIAQPREGNLTRCRIEAFGGGADRVHDAMRAFIVVGVDEPTGVRIPAARINRDGVPVLACQDSPAEGRPRQNADSQRGGSGDDLSLDSPLEQGVLHLGGDEWGDAACFLQRAGARGLPPAVVGDSDVAGFP